MINDSLGVLKSQHDTPDSVAFTRYADKTVETEFQANFQAPRGEYHKRISAAELWRVSKTQNHWNDIKKQKSFLASKFLPPFDRPLEDNLRELFTEGSSNIDENLL